MKLILRMLFLPLGFIKGLLEIGNSGARDLQNKLKYRFSQVDRNVIISDNSTIHNNCHILRDCILNNVELQSYTYVNRNSILQNVHVGKFCSIATNVQIGLGNHPTNLISTSTLFYRKNNTFGLELVNEDYPFTEYKITSIGHDVWIGSSGIILDGLQIGIGSVVAAGSVVTKNVPPYAIVAGIPAKVIKYRFSDAQIAKLLASEWWKKVPNEIKDLDILP